MAAGGCGTLILAAVELSVSFLSRRELVISDVAVHNTGELPRSGVPCVHAEPGACVVDADALDEHHGQGACEALGHNVGRQLLARSLLGYPERPLDLVLDGKVEMIMMLKKRIPIILLYLLFIAGLSSDKYG